MGFLDKVKEQATVATQAAKEAATKGQAKVDELQAKRSADAVLRDLGLAAYLSESGRAPATVEADIAGYVEKLKAFEAEHGPLG